MVCPEIKWVFAKISDFLISIPLQTDGVNLRYFKERFVDFKSHYSKIKRSKMDISNIYLKKRKFWNICT